MNDLDEQVFKTHLIDLINTVISYSQSPYEVLESHNMNKSINDFINMIFDSEYIKEVEDEI